MLRKGDICPKCHDGWLIIRGAKLFCSHCHQEYTVGGKKAMEHRPKNWKKGPVQFERGASALLRALREDGYHIDTGQVLEIEGQKITATKNQTLVLIPDDIE